MDLFGRSLWIFTCGYMVIAAPLARAEGDVEPWRAELDALRARVADQDRRLSDQDARLADQETTIAHLRREQSQSWLDARRAEEVDALIQNVLSDVDSRAAMSDNALHAGWNGNFFLASEDGKFLLKIIGQLQVRYTHNLSDATSDVLPGDDGADNSRGDVPPFSVPT